jgi:hypothetical protein
MASSSDLAESNLKRRRAFTNLERRNIRQRHAEHPGPQLALISWFVVETGHKINQSQVLVRNSFKKISLVCEKFVTCF